MKEINKINKYFDLSRELKQKTGRGNIRETVTLIVVALERPQNG